MKALTKIITIILIGSISTILLMTLVVSPLLTEVTAINAQVREKKVELAVLQKQILAFKTAQSDLGRATRKDEVLNIIPDREGLAATVLDLERAATATNTSHLLQIKEVTDPKDKRNVQLIAKKSGVEEIPYELSTDNDFIGTVNFLSYLEHLPHFTEIGKIRLTSERLTGSEEGVAGRTGLVSGVINGAFFVKIAPK